MAEVSASTLVRTQKSFRATFNAALEAYAPRWMSHAMMVPSDGLTENHNWLGRVPAMREWIGDKLAKELIGFDYMVQNRDWESTLAVKRNDIEDDRLGLYTPRIRDLAVRASAHPDKLISQRRVAGASALCYDGQYFYDTDHAEGSSGAQSNKLTGSGATAAQVRTDLFAAKAALCKFKDDQGEPYVFSQGNDDFVAVIPPDLLAVFDELNNPAPNSATPRTIVKYEIDPYLTDANDWYLDYVGMPFKPFIKQDRKPITFVALDDPNASESVFLRQQYYYGVEGRYEIAYGLWQMSIKITNT